ncbi:AraC family ligand binding domain-containing protein [Paenibacillus sp. GYB004]|uniref:AraC family ligand binding domain-containing protein n=1 Tax=Paenibacillus sp. GYB004 TaxID=2994393 RepID=UPI003FA72653
MSQTYPLIDVFSYRNESFLSSFFHTHSEYEILYVHAGQCQYLLGTTVVDLTPGDMVVLNGLSSHGPLMERQIKCTRTMVRFDETVLKPHLNQPRARCACQRTVRTHNCRTVFHSKPVRVSTCMIQNPRNIREFPQLRSIFESAKTFKKKKSLFSLFK